MSKQITFKDAMTIKEVSDILGVSVELITKRIREIFPEKMQKGKTTFLNEKEVTIIKMKIQENSELTSYDHTKLLNMPKTNLEKQLLIQQAMIFQQEMISELQIQNEELKEENSELKKQLEVPVKTMRSEINQLVRKKAVRENINYGSVWLLLYQEFNYRHHINIFTRAKNDELNILDYCEAEGLLFKLYNLAKDIL